LLGEYQDEREMAKAARRKKPRTTNDTEIGMRLFKEKKPTARHTNGEAHRRISKLDEPVPRKPDSLASLGMTVRELSHKNAKRYAIKINHLQTRDSKESFI
jgi:hypothetical protein